MKVCPVCKMTVNANSECPICGSTITYEPDVNSEKEKYIFNKYLVLYLLRKCLFSLICLLFAILSFFFIETKFHFIHLLPTFFAVASLLFSIFDRSITEHAQWKYSEEYAGYKVEYKKISTGILAVVFSLLLILVK